MHCAHILYLLMGKCILHIQPFMYTIIHTQTTSVGTDLILWAWTFSINITSPEFNRRTIFFVTLTPATHRQTHKKEPQSTSFFEVLAHFCLCPPPPLCCYINWITAHRLPVFSQQYQPLDSCQPLHIFQTVFMCGIYSADTGRRWLYILFAAGGFHGGTDEIFW